MKTVYSYDREADVLYVTFDTNEPSYCQELDDILLLERGVRSHRITGFRVLNFDRFIDKFCKRSTKMKKPSRTLKIDKNIVSTNNFDVDVHKLSGKIGEILVMDVDSLIGRSSLNDDESLVLEKVNEHLTTAFHDIEQFISRRALIN